MALMHACVCGAFSGLSLENMREHVIFLCASLCKVLLSAYCRAHTLLYNNQCPEKGSDCLVTWSASGLARMRTYIL